MPKRSNGKRRLWDQADSGARRRCRRPGGASLSLKASAIAAGTAVMKDTRSPGRASVGSRGATEAAHEAPTKRKLRKMDSLSAATQGPTARILRFVLRCVNGRAERDLESGVENARDLPRQVHRVDSRCNPAWFTRRQSAREINDLAQGRRKTEATESISGTGRCMASSRGFVACSIAIASHVGSIQRSLSIAMPHRGGDRDELGACGQGGGAEGGAE